MNHNAIQSSGHKGADRAPIPADVLRWLVDGHYGIVRDLRESTLAPNCPEIFVYGAKMTDTSVYFPGRGNADNSGAGLTPETAITAAVGETIERYCSGCWNTSDVVFGTYDTLRHSHEMLRAEPLNYFHPSQRRALEGYARFTPDTPLAWTFAYELARKQEVLVPASSIFLPFRRNLSDQREMVVFPSYSTGLSCGVNPWDALHHALCECVERDAFMNFWLNRLPLPHIDISGDAEISEQFSTYFDRDRLEYLLINTTTDIGLASVNCFLIDTSFAPPLVSSGGSAALSPRKAVKKAMLEAAHTYLWSRTLRGKAPEPADGFGNIISFDDHVGIHAAGKIFHSIDFVRNSGKRCSVDDLPSFDVQSDKEAAETVAGLLNAVGADVHVADLTTSDVGPLGLHVVRAFVPALIQLNAGFHMRNLGNRRIYELPRRMGLDDRVRTIDDLNPFPHSYP